MDTKLTKLLGITYPIIQGGMAWVSEAILAAAVSAAGGAGIIAAGGRDADYVREQIRLAKRLTDKPFGVNVMLMAENKDEVIEAICEEKPAFVTLGAGNPVPFFEKLSKAGVKKIPVVPSVKLAKRVEDSGADAIVIEGMEAGGHIGVLTTMALMTQVIPLINIPVIVGGGLADGRGLAAALVMGAAGIQMGTRFLIAEECGVHPNVKKKLLAAVDTDSVVTGLISGHGVRGIKNSFTEKYLALERKCVPQAELDKLATGTNRLAAVDGDVDNGVVLAGQSLLPLQKIEPVAVIVNTIMSEACQVLANAPKLLS
ncbi:nitronate monooxygenase [Sporomusa malonica]|uniref:Probable nitronate monooxygenase n=1 Tax=Sporomusa malonica TaxID=112901 RepID=A0A1W2EYP4_9FIRM|nr:nitronate monooxygenase [Sporomusa malonica]SMD14356.1 enoyl-[acyl-carrier protein] reductase II [Sporomusa malonica]